MKHNEIILRNQAHPRLTANTTTSSNAGTAILYVDTGPGFIELGPANSSHCHIQTDRSNFYFNKELRVNTGVIGSYDEDLYLRRASNSSHQIQISTSQVTSTLGITAPDATLGNTSTGAGALRLYDTGNNSLLFSGTGSNAFRMDMDGTSAIGTLTMSDFDIHMSTGNLTRGQHHTGHLEGSYNNVGANGYKSNPIYTIGSNYNPADAALSNMYGIGYTRASQASFISMGGASNWGLYVAAAGSASIFLDAGNGHICSTAEHYAGSGAAANPAYSFVDDTNTGMYRYTSDQIGFATAGTHRMSIDSTGLRLNTGYYIAQSSGETTDFKSNAASNFMRLRNNGGTVHGGVYGSGSEIGFLDRDGQWAIRHAADSHTYFYINNSERVHIDNDGLDIVQGSLMMAGQHAVREKYYSGTSNIGASGSWYTLCYITENATPAYISLKFSAHSTQTFVVTTGYHGSNAASIQMLSGTWTQNGAYPGASAVRVLKDSNSNYRFQLQLTYGSGPTSFALYARAWGGTPVNDIVGFESSLTVDTTTGTTIDSMNTNFTGSGSSRAHRGADGSSTLPSYTFNSDSNTGMYKYGGDAIGFTTNGTTRLRIDTSLNLMNMDITAVNRLTFNDPGVTEGIKWAGGNEWQIYESPDNQTNASGNLQFTNGSGNGTRRMTISSTKVTTGAGVGLDLTTSSGNVRGMLLSSESAPHLRISTSGNEQIGFYDGGTSGTLNILIEGAGHLDLKTGNLNMNGTTVINTSRELKNVTLGYGSAGSRFQVSGWHDSNDGNNRLYFASGSTSYWKCAGTGSHIWRNGSDVSRAELDSSGNFIAEGNVTAYGSASDIRIKENIEVIPDSVEKVKSLRGVTFNYKKDGKRSTGLVAQELQKVLPEAVYETKDGAEDGEDILAIRYGNVVGLLVEALKEQQTQIDNLTSLVNQLKEK